MGLISQRLPGLMGGVSQKPAPNRRADQVAAMQNALLFPRFGDGPSIRPPTTHVATLVNGTTTNYDSAFYHWIKVSDTERYIMVLVNGDLKLFNAIDGTAQVVSFPNGKSYLTPGATGQFKALTVGDYTFIVNRDTVVKQGSKRSPAQQFSALIKVNQGDYSTRYTVVLGGITISVVTTDNTSSASKQQIATDEIATSLITALTANSTINSTYTFQRFSSLIQVTRNDGADFSCDIYDGLNDKGMQLVKGSVPTFDSLPSLGIPGTVAKVEGDPGSTADDSWVVYENAADQGSSVVEKHGIWRETVAPNTPLDLDATTMPWALIHNGKMFEDTAQQSLPSRPTYQVDSTTQSTYYFEPGGFYPKGYNVTFTCGVDSGFNYTVSVDGGMTATALVTALAAAFVNGPTDSGAGHTYFASASGSSLTLVRGISSATFTDSLTESRPNAGLTFWNTSLSLTIGALVGVTFYNKTDGSSGTITANGSNWITVGSLTGGVNNVFTPGDLCYPGATWLFNSIPWNERAVGDTVTAPWPSFVGRKISDMFFRENRLGILAGDAAVLSGSGDLFNFFRQTTTQVLASDVIDVKSAYKEVAAFDTAVDWDTGVVLWSSAGQQFLLTGAPALSPTTVSIDHIGSHHVDANVRPVTFGANMAFVCKKADGYCQVQELYRTGPPAAIKTNAMDVTEDVPTYIQGTPKMIAVDYSLGIMVLVVKGPSNWKTLYVRNVSADSQGNQTQNAWHNWLIPGHSTDQSDVVAADISQGTFYMVVLRPEGVMLEMFSLTSLQDPATVNFGTDRVGFVTFAFPTYSMNITMSPFFWRDQSGNPQRQGRLQIRKMRLGFTKTKAVTTVVTPAGRTAVTYVKTYPNPTEAFIDIPVLCRNTDMGMTLTSIIGLTITDVSWEGYFANRNQLT